MNNTPVICTIVTKCYLAQARCLADSFLEHHPDGRVFLLLVDKVDGYFDPTQEPFTTILVEDIGIPDLGLMVLRYDVVELCTAVKPFFLEYLFNNHEYDKICYFDPDIYVYRNMNEEIWEKLSSCYPIMLTPHLLHSPEDDFIYQELNIMQAGIYNLGFIGLSRHLETEKLLHWWKNRLTNFCYMKPDQGMTVDQRWIDFVPSLGFKVYISRDPGLNVAYWDLYHRYLEYSDGEYKVNGVPLKFFHLSGYSPNRPNVISKYQNHFTFDDRPDIKLLFDQYGKNLCERGYHIVKNWPYAYAAGSTILSLEPPTSSNFGVNIVGYVKGEFGVAEGARANLRSLESAAIPFVINNIVVDFHRNLDTEYHIFTEDNPYPINLVQVNADSVYEVIRRFGHRYFKDRYNIGIWLWELTTFPLEWQASFTLFDEIWTPSSFCAEAISQVSPIPVVKIPLSISLPHPSIDREGLGLPKDKFIFLFMFDFFSIFERKNPTAIIKAFKNAFNSANEDVLLVIKFSNAHIFPEQKAELMGLAENYPAIRFIEGHLTKDQVNGLLYSCDCYVSLHRAEGFGLTMAEAMFYGKPVIATAYSSNMDFMNSQNSFLVDYDLIELTEDIMPYKKGNVWANADINHAAALMRYVFENYEQAKQVGERAAREISSLLGSQAVGKKMKSRLEHIIRTLNNSTAPTRRRELQTTKEWFESQAQAWQKTAQQGQLELESCQHQLRQVQADLEALQTRGK
jgi:glycosyltransferase involved in cell wall biosynthesis